MTTNSAVWGSERRPSNGIFSLVVRAAEMVVRAGARRRTAIATSELDDHVLRDINLDPDEVRRLHHSALDMISQSPSGSAYLLFVGRSGVFSVPIHTH